MPLDKEEFKFPDEKVEDKKDDVEFEVEGEGKPEIEVVDDTPEGDRGRAPMKEPPKELTDDELNKYDEGVRKRIQHFTKGYHEERRAKEAALREREEAIRIAKAVADENKKLKGSLSEGKKALHEQALKQVEGEVETFKARLRDALEAGNANDMAYWQDQLTSAKIKQDRLQNLQVEPLQETDFGVQIPQPSEPEPAADPKLLAWRENNQWFGPNKRMTAYALGLHDDLVAEGIPPGSDEYWKRIDTDVRTRFPEQFGSEEPADAPKTQRVKSNVVAPATRSTAPKKIVLTKSQVEIAKRLGVPLELYARKVAEEMRK
jgi:hypothetical protein